MRDVEAASMSTYAGSRHNVGVDGVVDVEKGEAGDDMPVPYAV